MSHMSFYFPFQNCNIQKCHEKKEFTSFPQIQFMTFLLLLLLTFSGLIIIPLCNNQLRYGTGEEMFETVKLVFLNDSDNYDSKVFVNYVHHYINFTFSQKVYSMYLFKPDDLYDPESLGWNFHEVTDLHCVYSGKILSEGRVVGTVSLSSCHHLNGLEGFIHLENEHYHITPIVNGNTKTEMIHLDHHRSDRSSDGVAAALGEFHKMTKLSEKKSPIASYGSDTKRVSSEKIIQAQKDMLNSQEELEDEQDDNDPDDNLNFLNNTSQRILFAQRKTTVQKNKPRNRVARVIELAVFTDEMFFQKWAEQYPTNTELKINQFILALVNNMNYLYAQPSMKQRVSFRLVHIEVQKKTPKGLKTSPVGDTYLDTFCAYAGKKDKKGAIWDHAMMITGHDLLSVSGGDLLGIAFGSTMCLRYYSCSLTEFEKGFETAFTATHEVGHSLGMEHDGELMNTKCNPTNFIMAGPAGNGQINWSPCSNNNLKNFLKSGDPSPRKKAPKHVPRCLTKRGSRKKSIRYETGKMPGQTFTVHEQCKTACEGCTPHVVGKYPYNDICWMLHCKDEDNDIVPVHPALEGTACGGSKKKWCRNGKCQ